MAAIAFGCFDMGDQDCFVCEGVRAGRSLELGGFITACWVLIYTGAQVFQHYHPPHPFPPEPVASVCCAIPSSVGSIRADTHSPSLVVKHRLRCNNTYRLCTTLWCISSNDL